jgi:hypothetical protein
MDSAEDRRIKSIVVVGGGTAGWVAAAYLNRALTNVKVTLIESSSTGIIGVGEATVPSLPTTFRFLGMDEDDWMPKCNASFKCAVKFDNWKKPQNGKQHTYIHPFFPADETLLPAYAARYSRWFPDGVSLMHFWLKRHLAGDPTPYVYVASPAARLCDLKKSPRYKGHPEYEFTHAYHLDAGLIVQYLRKLCVARGVENVVDHITGVKLDDKGFIESVSTRGGRTIAGDLFIDCSGFDALLISKALGVDFISDRDSLFCDAAVALHVKYNPERDSLHPYTLATARDAGWIWDIPLFHRKGGGYVYSSAFLKPDEAERELRAHYGAGAEGAEARHIKIRTGRHAETWVKNCVAVGLAANFIEPLESTTIALIEYALGALVTYFPDKDFAPALIRRYNDATRNIFEGTRDFITLHYILSDRDDTPFWRAVQSDTRVPDTLRERMEFGLQGMPMPEPGRSHAMWWERNWAAIFAGMGHLPNKPWPLLHHIDIDDANKVIEDIQRKTEHLAAHLPDHYDYLRHGHYKNATGPEG